MNRFENGFHSFKKVIIGLTKNEIDEFDLKEIIINFHHSIEVLFKYILFNKNSLFIYNNIDNIIEQNLNIKFGINRNNEEKTITFNNAINRLIIICDETIDKYTYNRFKNLNKFRNSLIHDELDLVKEEVEQLIVSILPTVIMILRKHLPEEDEKEFIKFIDDGKIVAKLNNLYIDNDIWRIITKINLLTTYESIDYYNVSMRDKKHINKMLLLLGCEIYEGYFGTSIDGFFYSSTISYLKQEICDYIMSYSRTIKKYKNDDKVRELINKNEVIADLLRKYIYNMICYLNELMNIDRKELISLIKGEKSVNTYFENVSLVNKINIYELLFYIWKTAKSYVEICDNKKRRDKFLKEILLYEDEELLSASNIYSCLIRWFNEAKWYNNINFKDISNEIMNVFIENNYLRSEISEEVSEKIYYNDFFNELIGEIGEFSSIDYIDEHWIEGINIIIGDINNSTDYTLILDVSVSVETYMDHEYHYNGTEQTYVEVSGQITQDNKFSIDNVEYLGRNKLRYGFAFK
ncbi:hypothetical protein [Clostridium paraputrificum]|uniref:hypothetical protein n=1 Tax=Clostridium paraputrificum TaxID=29363 RepID=UPI002FCDAC25